MTTAPTSAAEIQLDQAQARTFLTALGRNGDTRMRGFSPWKTAGRKSPLCPATALQWQKEGIGVYIVINPGGDCDDDITECVALFCEWDDQPLVWQVNAWKELNLPEPSLQVDSGGKSIHNYWIFQQPIPKEQWKDLQARLISHTKSDPKLKNASRVMRLPGTWHFSTGSEKPRVVVDRMVQIVHTSEPRYSATDLDNLLPQLPKPQPQTPTLTHTSNTPAGTVHLSDLLPKKQSLTFASGVSEGGRNDACYRLATNLLGIEQHCSIEGSSRLGFSVQGSAAQCLEDFNRRCSPPLSPTELQAILSSASQSNPEPDPGLAERIKYHRNKLNPHRQNNTASPSQYPTDDEPEETPAEAIGRLVDELLNLRLNTTNTWAEEMATISSLSRGYGVARQDIERRILEALAERWHLSITQTHSGRRTNRRAASAEDDREGQQMLVDGFLPYKRDALLFGPGGVGKTTAAVGLAWSVISGQPFLDHQIPSDITGKVLWIGSDGGDGAYEMWDNTAQDYGIAEDPRWIDGCVFWGSDPVNDVGSWACTPAGLQELKEELETGGYALVVIDSWKAVLELAGIDFGIGPVGTVVRFLQALIGQYCSALYLHHPSGNSKGKGIAASGGNQNVNQIPYAVHQLIPEPASDNQPRCVRWSVHKLRGYQAREFLYRLTDSGFQILEGDLITNCADQLIITIADLEGLGTATTSATIKNMLSNIAEKTVSNNLTRLRQRGLLKKTGACWHLTRRGKLAHDSLFNKP